uniref:RUN domain-containing protein n=1 Tax=Romanomermis culicivorax TaxID=13658 RepID=A0A915L0X8_ROMCU
MERRVEFSQEQESRNVQEIAVKQIILSKLLDSVKQCQSEFGARNELATIENAKVKFLLLQLETVFVHGLKKKLSFLNEFYEQWAFIMDTEMISAFSQMATGMQTILFALKTNDAELNAPPSLNTEEFLTNSSSNSILFSESATNNKRIPQPILNLQSSKTVVASTPKSSNTNKQAKSSHYVVSLHFKDSGCQMRVVFPDRSSSLSTPIMKSASADNPFSDDKNTKSPVSEENLLYLEKVDPATHDFTSDCTDNVFTIDSTDREDDSTS